MVEAAGACHQTITAALQKRHRDDAQCVAVVAVEIRGESAAAFVAEEVAEGGEAALEGAGLAALGKLCLAQLQRYAWGYCTKARAFLTETRGAPE